MVTSRYILDKSSPPGRLQSLVNQGLIPAAIELATEIEIATGSVSREVRKHPRLALILAGCIVWLGARVLGKRVLRE